MAGQNKKFEINRKKKDTWSLIKTFIIDIFNIFNILLLIFILLYSTLNLYLFYSTLNY